MIVYEITTTVEENLIKRFERFIIEVHIPDLLETGYFEGAEIASVSEGNYRIRYLTENQTTLEKYLATDAERLREDFIRHFPEGVSVERNILEVLRSWD